MRRTLTAAIAAAACAIAGTTVALSPVGSSAAEPESPLVLVAPKRSVVELYGNRAYLDLGVNLKAVGGAFELWSKRASYDDPIVTTWKHGDTEQQLPPGTMTSFEGLTGFLDITMTDRKGAVAYQTSADVCLNGEGARVTPEGASTSPYPWDCPWHPFTVGSVQGIAAGWAVQLDSGDSMVRLREGRYRATVSITPQYRELFGIADADASRTTRVKVVKSSCCEGEPGHGLREPAAADDAPEEPVGDGPTGERLEGRADGPVPNLASLPAFAIGVSRNGNFLEFAATVWNAGPSPLVVDAFRRDDEDVMDAYQYFYDENGEQTSYVPVGEMEWDARGTHQHWHFRDFARYRLLDTPDVNSPEAEVSRSKKEAFCLANTDATDYTVPFANWRPGGTDLHTACGDYSSLAVREVLDVGSGDTYAQFRAGQSFRLKGVPNGVYYVAVEANPDGNLVEATPDDNVAYRKIKLGGKDGARTVKVFPVGIIED